MDWTWFSTVRGEMVSRSAICLDVMPLATSRSTSVSRPVSSSYHLCSSLDSQFASRVIGRTTNQVCEGELLQIDNRNNFDLDEETYLQIITRKTASLSAACCLLGAKLAGATDERVDRLELYGMSIGIAFQIQDDILDLIGDAEHGRQDARQRHREREDDAPDHPLPAHRPAGAPVAAALPSGQPGADRVERIRNLILPSKSIAVRPRPRRQLVDRAVRRAR